jgi:hypothetical protein
MRTPEFSRCLLRLPPNTLHQGRPARHYVHHSFRVLMLCKDVIQVIERGSHLPTVYVVLFRRANRTQPNGLCRQHRRKDPVE